VLLLDGGEVESAAKQRATPTKRSVEISVLERLKRGKARRLALQRGGELWDRTQMRGTRTEIRVKSLPIKNKHEGAQSCES
jgi:hypothetical protein